MPAITIKRATIMANISCILIAVFRWGKMLDESLTRIVDINKIVAAMAAKWGMDIPIIKFR